jgi:5'-nucleotidase
MNFLLTNDDGIEAPGLWAAAEALAKLGPVLVVAPMRNFSGYGAALPPTSALSYYPYRRSGLAMPGITAFAVSGTPAACMQVGLSGALSKRPIDLVVSGINDALNVGHDIFLFGTVGAALTGHLLGFPALAVSLETGASGVPHWDTAAWAVQEVIRTWTERKECTQLLYNINVPNQPLARVVGVQMTTLSKVSCLTRYQIRATSDSTLAVTERHDQQDAPRQPGTDVWAVEHRHISITPLRLSSELRVGSTWTESTEQFSWELPRPLLLAA